MYVALLLRVVEHRPVPVAQPLLVGVALERLTHTQSVSESEAATFIV
jgi:hypothetical protein